MAATVFDPKAYLAANDDVRKFIRDKREKGKDTGTRYRDAYGENTVGEERKWLRGLNSMYGKDAKDMRAFTPEEIAQYHYKEYGEKEGRLSSQSYQDAYNSLYPAASTPTTQASAPAGASIQEQTTASEPAVDPQQNLQEYIAETPAVTQQPDPEPAIEPVKDPQQNLQEYISETPAVAVSAPVEDTQSVTSIATQEVTATQPTPKPTPVAAEQPVVTTPAVASLSPAPYVDPNSYLGSYITATTTPVSSTKPAGFAPIAVSASTPAAAPGPASTQASPIASSTPAATSTTPATSNAPVRDEGYKPWDTWMETDQRPQPKKPVAPIEYVPWESKFGTEKPKYNPLASMMQGF